MKKVLSFDFGASSVRAILGTYDGYALSLKEVHRFDNNPLVVGDTLCWDIETMFNEVKQTLKAVCNNHSIESISVNTWGVDFGLIEKNGQLISPPVHYRDDRTKSMIEEVEKLISLPHLYENTGNQIININTIFQLAYLKKHKNEDLNKARSMLMMPDLFNYFLTGIEKTEETIASTTQLFNPYEKTWNEDIIQALGFSRKIFKEVIKPGDVIGNISNELAEELSIPTIPVVAVASHDTASAVASVPAKDEDFLFVSSGTWSLIGTELNSPNISEKSYHYNITNESGVEKTTRYLKNVTGLWVLEETIRQFENEGRLYSYDQVAELAAEADPFTCFIDTDYEAFQSPGNMPQKIKQYAHKTGQTAPETDGQLFRTIYESLALKYRHTFQEVEDSIDKTFKRVHIFGGGSKAEILCQMVADATNLEVAAGPVEATVIGNVLVQLISSGEPADIEEGRKIVRQSFPVTYYHPHNHAGWDRVYDRYAKVLKNLGKIEGSG